MSTPDPVRAALYAFLDADATLGDLLTGIHYGEAPEDAKHPYAIFARTSNVSSWSYRTFARNQLWLVKGVCRSGPPTAAEAIDARCEELLNDAELAIDGSQCLYVRREAGIPDLPEIDAGETIFSVGGLYRIWSMPE
jgi:hypothetical protein